MKAILQISLSSSENGISFKKNCRGNENTHFMFNKRGYPALPGMRNCESRYLKSHGGTNVA